MFFSLKFRFRRLHRIYHNRHTRRVIGAGIIVMTCILVNSGCFYFFERTTNDKLTLWDSFWLSLTTITTVGYGDYSPTTLGGRLATMILLYVVGLASFPYVITQIVDTTVEGRNDRRYGFIDCRNLVEDHIIVVNFPAELKVVAIMDQLASDPVTSHRPIVILTDNIEELPFKRPNTYFVRGAPLHEESLNRANIERAHVALILTPNTDERAADALTVSTVSLIESLNPTIRVIAECSSIKHLTLFSSFKCTAVIPTNNIAAKVLAQEICDQGIAPAVSELLTGAEGSEFYSEPIELNGISFNELRGLLVELKAQAILVGIIRENQHRINPPLDLQIRQTDRLIIITENRSDWKRIHAQLLDTWRAT